LDLVGFGCTGLDLARMAAQRIEEKDENEDEEDGGGPHPLYRVLPRKLSRLHRLARLYKIAIQGATQGATKCYTGCYKGQRSEVGDGLAGELLPVRPSTLRVMRDLEKSDPSGTRQEGVRGPSG
jgi:hypothetical protein